MKPLVISRSLGWRLGAGLSVLAALLISAPAHGDDGLPAPPPWMDPTDALNPLAIVSGAGVKVGEGTVFQPQVGLETGVVSNVFYSDKNAVTAGLLRLLIEIGTGSLPNQRLSIRATGDTSEDAAATPTVAYSEPGDFQYSANAYLSWDQYLSTNDNVTTQGGLGGGLLLRGIVNPLRPLQFSFQENFTRLIRATNFESRSDTNRDINQLGLRLNYVPTGRSLSGYLYYENTIDVFESDSQRFADRMLNTVGLRVNWQWLPLTRVFGDVLVGYDTGIGSSSTKVSSVPVVAMTGIQTALTLNTTINAHIGYTNGFYSSGPSYSSLIAGIMAGYRYSPLGRVTALYGYSHSDSINANFYRDHELQLTIEQYLVPFVVFAQPELHLRRYEGTLIMGASGTTRDDTIFSLTSGMRYSFRDWLVGTLDYKVTDVSTDFMYTTPDGATVNPSYVRHELLLGVRAAY